MWIKERLQRIQASRIEKRQKWENLCKRCGQCCYERERRGGRLIIHYELPCRYLDIKTNLCTVYENRFKYCLECKKMTRFRAWFYPLLPADCGYVEWYRKGKKLAK